jgi:serine/threonine protein kinase
MLQRGDTIDRYRIDGLVGEGGMGSVYSAYDTKLRRRVALKVWRSDAEGERNTVAEPMRRMMHEAQAAAALTHPNVVSIFDVGMDRGVPFIAMELVEGTPLLTKVGDTSVPLATKLSWLLGVARALVAAHARGLVHRDIKPENVMVCPDGAVKVLDFGIARRDFAIPDGAATTSDGPASSRSMVGAMAGTPKYMPPERLLGQPADAIADQFAWGLVAYELLTGHYPWTPTMQPFGFAVGPATPLGELEPDAPLDVQRLVTRAMERDPRKRFPSMEEIVALLETRSAPAAARPPSPSLRRPTLPTQRGDVFGGKYRVERVMARGGFGIVVEATHLALEQRVAVKFLNPEGMGSPDAVARFSREAKAAARLKNEHIVRVLDVASLDDGTPYMVMEYLEGRDLEQVVSKQGPLPYRDAIYYMLQACEALAEAHAAGIVHRDLKPANLHVSRAPNGQPTLKVLDFGISKVGDALALVDDDARVTKATEIIGSPAFMSPEQLRTPRDVDSRSDVWSLGVVLYEITTGIPPFAAGSLAEICAKVLGFSPPPPSAVRPGISPSLDGVIARCLRVDPRERFASMAELGAALRAVADGVGAPETSLTGSSPSHGSLPMAGSGASPGAPASHADIAATAVTGSLGAPRPASSRPRALAAALVAALSLAVVVLAYALVKQRTVSAAAASHPATADAPPSAIASPDRPPPPREPPPPASDTAASVSTPPPPSATTTAKAKPVPTTRKPDLTGLGRR